MPYDGHMDIWIGGHSAAELLRLSRRGRWPRLHASRDRAVDYADVMFSQAWREAVKELDGYLEIGTKKPLIVYVPDKGRRIRTACVDCRVCSTMLPKDSFLLAELASSGSSVRIASPELSFAQMAEQLTQRLMAFDLERPVALAMLVAYGMELCGSYARDPMDPYGGDCDFRLDAVTSPERLRAWLGKARHLKGLALARAAAKRVLAGSASPEESAHAMLLGFPSNLGGINVGVPLLNDQLVLSKRDMELLERPSLRPDLYFPRLRLVIEHYGAMWHEGVSRMVEDVMRIQCYSALGIRVFPTTARDLATADAYESFLRKLAYGIGVDHGLALRDRFLSHVNDPRARDLRSDIISALSTGRHACW